MKPGPEAQEIAMTSMVRGSVVRGQVAPFEGRGPVAEQLRERRKRSSGEMCDMQQLGQQKKEILSWIFARLGEIAEGSASRLWIYLAKGYGLDTSWNEVELPAVNDENDQGLPGRAARTGAPILCQDVLEDELFNAYYLQIFTDTRAQWCLPLWSADCLPTRSLCPVLCLEHSEPIDQRLRPQLDLICALGGVLLAVDQGFEILAAVETDDRDRRWRLERQIDALAGAHPEMAVRKLFNAMVMAQKDAGLTGLAFWQYRAELDYFCCPIYSSGIADLYSRRTRPRRLGLLAEVFEHKEARFVDVEQDRDYARSCFLQDLKIKAAAYVPARDLATGERPSDQAPRGVLFANYEKKQDFSPDQRELLQHVADAAARAVRLRSEARRYRLATQFDARSDHYPQVSSRPEIAIKHLLQHLGDRLRSPRGALYLHDLRSRLWVRYARTSCEDELAQRFSPTAAFDRVFRRGELAVLGQEQQEEIGLPAELHRERLIFLPLYRDQRAVGCCFFIGGEAEVSLSEHELIHLTVGLASLLDLEHHVTLKTGIIELLSRFLRIYEYVTRESSPKPLLEAFLDALLEESTADACYAFLCEPDSGRLAQAVARGGVLRPDERPTAEDLQVYLDEERPRFFFDADVCTGLRSSPIRAQAILPLVCRGQRFGLLYVEYHAEHAFSDEDRWFFPILAHQLSQSLRHFEHTRIRLDEVHSLAASGAAIARLGSPSFRGKVEVEDESRKLTQQARNFTHADFAELYVRQAEGLVLQVLEGAENEEASSSIWPEDEGLIGWVCQNGQPLLIPDVSAPEAKKKGYLENVVFPDTKSELLVPIVDDGKVVAVLNLESRRVGEFRETDLHFVEAIAAQAVAVRRAAELQETRRQLEQERNLLRKINTIAQEVASKGQTLVLERILEALRDEIEADLLSIHLLADDFAFDPRRSVAIPYRPELLRGHDLDNSILGGALKDMADSRHDHVLIRDISNPGPDFKAAEKQLERRSAQSIAELVVAIRQGERIIGVINVEHASPKRLEQHLDLIKSVVNGISNALHLASHMETAQHGATREQLAKADAFLQLLGTTVFHDASSLVIGIEGAIDHFSGTYRELESDPGLPSDLLAAYDQARTYVRPALVRLKRLSTVLPRDIVLDSFDLLSLVNETFAKDAQPALPHFEASLFTIEVDIAAVEGELRIWESRDWVVHILENLAGNSFRSMAEKHAKVKSRRKLKLKVNVFRSDDRQWVGARVSDEGLGVAETIAEDIGRQQIMHQDAEDRSLLGIFHKLASEHVQSLGGRLELKHNEPGQGCTFELRYPIHRESSSERDRDEGKQA